MKTEFEILLRIFEIPILTVASMVRVGGSYFSKVTSYLLLITSSNVTRYSYILLPKYVTSNILHITFQIIASLFFHDHPNLYKTTRKQLQTLA